MMNKLVAVDWVDASFQGERQLSQDSLVPGIWVRTAGFLVREDKKSISVALDKAEEHDDEWRHIANIPKLFIRKQRLLLRTTRSKKGEHVVYIKWIDASFQEGQYDTDEIAKEPVMVETVGVLAAESKTWLGLALHYYHGNNRPWKYVAHVRKNYIVEERRYRL